jgi:hypothetical protein
MNTLPEVCPFCGGELIVTHVNCRQCDTDFEGRFSASGMAPYQEEQQTFIERFVLRLQPEQLAFVETFVRCEGRIKNMEAELGLSYPTIRKNLDEVIRALGYEPEKEEKAAITEDRRREILERLDSGLISAEEAMRLLGGEE